MSAGSQCDLGIHGTRRQFKIERIIFKSMMFLYKCIEPTGFTNNRNQEKKNIMLLKFEPVVISTYD